MKNGIIIVLIIIMALSVNSISAVELDNNQTDIVESFDNNFIDSDNLLSWYCPISVSDS